MHYKDIFLKLFIEMQIDYKFKYIAQTIYKKSSSQRWRTK
jgi:hypothetical protein